MHFVLTTFGSAGDVFPMIGLALQLQQRGHTVLLATNGYFAPLAEKYGIDFEPLGTADDYLNCIQNPDLWNPRKAFQYLYRIFQPWLKQQHELLVRQAAQKSTIGIASCLCFGARMAQESHGIPVLTVHLQPAVIWSDLAPPIFPNLFGPRWLKRMLFRIGEKLAVDRLICPDLNAWRKELGLPPMKHLIRWWNSPTGILCLFPDWYAAPQEDWPQPVIQTDFPFWNDDSHRPLPNDVEHFLQAGSPPIVFTPGTANVHGRRFFAAAVEACRQLHQRGLLLTRHPEQLPATLPHSVQHVPYVPLDLLLKRSAAFVHHGGIGSTSQGLLAGIPQLITPLAHDQFDNAARVIQLNVGRSLAERSITGAHLTRSLWEILNASSLTAACQSVRTRLSPGQGLKQAVEAIEARLGSHQHPADCVSSRGDQSPPG